MLFNSYIFIFVFLPLTVGGYYLFRRIGSELWALGFVTICSIVFYGYWNVAYVPLLLISIALNYGAGAVILAQRQRLWSKIALILGVSANVAALGYFKYANFLIDQAEFITGNEFAVARVVMPLAVSFYTFQQIAYLVDCWRGQISNRSLLRYAFVVTFFPHLIAGPIVRFREIAPQFRTIMSKPAAINLCIGGAVFVIGLAKKVLIADYFGEIASPLFREAQQAGAIDPVSAWIAALSYALQLYFDFSGYSDMAIGLARMFGFRLAVNFLSPYKSASIAEFWRRWHITLSRFLRDYVYLPLGGNRAGKRRTYVNLMATMAIGGLWHGAAWTFVVWGIYHGLLLALHRAWRSKAPAWTRLEGLRPFWVLLTFMAVVVGWVLFKAPDFTTAATILAAMGGVSGLTVEAVRVHSQEVYGATAAGLAACWLLPNVYQIFHRYRPGLILRGQYDIVRPRPAIVQWRFSIAEAAALSAVLVGCIYSMRTSVSEFLYFMF